MIPRALDEQELRFSYVVSAQHMGLVNSLRQGLDDAAAIVSRRAGEMASTVDRALQLLSPLCFSVDAHPSRRSKESRIIRAARARARSQSSAAAVEGFDPRGQGSLGRELRALLARKQSDPSSVSAPVAEGQATTLLVPAGVEEWSDGENCAAGLDSEEEAQLHAELDAWVHAQERMEAFGGNQLAFLASVFQRACHAINDVEEMYRTIALGFRAAIKNPQPSTVPAVTIRELSVALELLAVPVSACDLEEMFEEALYLAPVSSSSVTAAGNVTNGVKEKKRRVAFTAVIAASETLRQELMSIQTDEVRVVGF